eukprot:GGOE01001172.1.p1 GENE.GGOE01001172.1~~GGOE01001172.1.p1  ORF type:complete len:1250 (-),score=339.64 GGOE01001172.1:479-4171(-)
MLDSHMCAPNCMPSSSSLFTPQRSVHVTSPHNHRSDVLALTDMPDNPRWCPPPLSALALSASLGELNTPNFKCLRGLSSIVEPLESTELRPTPEVAKGKGRRTSTRQSVCNPLPSAAAPCTPASRNYSLRSEMLKHKMEAMQTLQKSSADFFAQLHASPSSPRRSVSIQSPPSNSPPPAMLPPADFPLLHNPQASTLAQPCWWILSLVVALAAILSTLLGFSALPLYAALGLYLLSLSLSICESVLNAHRWGSPYTRGLWFPLDLIALSLTVVELAVLFLHSPTHWAGLFLIRSVVLVKAIAHCRRLLGSLSHLHHRHWPRGFLALPGRDWVRPGSTAWHEELLLCFVLMLVLVVYLLPVFWQAFWDSVVVRPDALLAFTATLLGQLGSGPAIAMVAEMQQTFGNRLLSVSIGDDTLLEGQPRQGFEHLSRCFSGVNASVCFDLSQQAAAESVGQTVLFLLLLGVVFVAYCWGRLLLRQAVEQQMEKLVEVLRSAQQNPKVGLEGCLLDDKSTTLDADSLVLALQSLVDELEVRARTVMEQSVLLRTSEHLRLLNSASSSSKSYFLMAMSHEMRSPLAVILSSAELLQSTELSPAQRDLLVAIATHGEAALENVNDILGFSQLSDHDVKLESKPLCIYDVVEDACLALRFRGKTLNVTIHVAPALPPLVLGDYGRLEEVLLKLLQNAVQFTPVGGQVAITVRRASATEAAKLNQRQSKLFLQRPVPLSFASMAQLDSLPAAADAPASALKRPPLLAHRPTQVSFCVREPSNILQSNDEEAAVGYWREAPRPSITTFLVSPAKQPSMTLSSTEAEGKLQADIGLPGACSHEDQQFPDDEVSSFPAADAYCFEVVDTGIGVPEADQERVMEPFVQVDQGESRKVGGLGLGLSVCRHLVEAMGGFIGLQSPAQLTDDDPARGTRAFFVIPLSAADGAAGSTSRRSFSEPLPEFSRVHVYLAMTSHATHRQLSSMLAALHVSAETVSLCSMDHLRTSGTTMCIVDADDLPALPLDDLQPFLQRQALLVLTQPHQEVDFPQTATKPLTRRALYNWLRSSLSTMTVLSVGTPTSGPRVSSMWAPTTPRSADCEVLVAEDTVSIQKVLALQLCRLGYKAVICNDGMEVLRRLSMRWYPLILMDYHMPNLDGVRCTIEIRSREKAGKGTYENRPPIVIIATTADVLAGTKAQCLDAGMTAHLCKPVTLKDLALALKQHLPAGMPQPRSPAFRPFSGPS